jgi:aminoglycoside phosphotransferase (APT) family kinase protein
MTRGSPPPGSTMLPWQAEHVLDVDTVRAALTRTLPAFSRCTLEPLGEGFDFKAFLVDAQWVFRFAKRRLTARGLAREMELLDALAGNLAGVEPAIAIPAYRYRHAPAVADPPAFGAYRLLPGEPLITVPGDRLDPAAIGTTLGGWLRRLHASTPTPPPARTPDHFAECIGEYRGMAEQCRPHLPEALYAALWALLAPSPPPFAGPTRFCHADLGAEHVLVDPAAARVTAVIDWGDAGWDDPTTDFVGLWAWGGDIAVNAAIATYGEALSPANWRRLRLRSACYGLGMLHYGVFDARPHEAAFGLRLLERMWAAGQLTDVGRPDRQPDPA